MTKKITLVQYLIKCKQTHSFCIQTAHRLFNIDWWHTVSVI